MAYLTRFYYIVLYFNSLTHKSYSMTKNLEAGKTLGASPANTRNTAKKAETQAPEVEALKKQVEELQKVLKGQPKSFEDRIKFFEEKQAHIKRLQKLDAYKDFTVKMLETLQTETEKDNFFTENFTLKVVNGDGYRAEKELLKIHHPVLIGEVLEFALAKLDNKREDLINLINA